MPNVESLREGDPAAVGPYRLVGRLGAGGHGVVYLGQARNGTPVAVKVLHEGLTGGERLVKEIAAARRVEPFCLARVLGASTSGRPYIVAEYVDGPSLRESGRLGAAELQRLAVATATALDALHQASVLHLNFKPANVLLGPDGARVVDFGISGAVGTGVSATGTIAGTPAYMAPEQLAGKAAGAPADVFAWASTIVFAATGVPPFGDDSLPAVINRILREEPRIDDLPRPLREVVAACLAKDPAARPAMRDVLLRLIGGGDRPPRAQPSRLGPARLPDDDYATPAAPSRDPAPASGPHERGGSPALGPHDHGTVPISAVPEGGGTPAPAARSGDTTSSPATRHNTGHADPASQSGTAPASDAHSAWAAHHGAGARRPSASHPNPASFPLAAPVAPSSAAVEYPAAGHPAATERPGPGEAATPSASPMQHSALVDILVAGRPGTGGKAVAKRPGRRRVKTLMIVGVSGVSVLALAAAIVWLTPTTPTSKAENVGGGTVAPTSEAARTPTRTPRPQRTRTVRPTPQAEGTPSAVATDGTTPSAATAPLRVSLRPRGTRNGDCWAGGEVTPRALVARTGGPLTFRYAWLIDGAPVGRSSALISENGRLYLTSPATLTGAAGTTHRVTLRITSPVPVQRSMDVTLCDDL